MMRMFLQLFLLTFVLSNETTISDSFESLEESKTIWIENGDWELTKKEIPIGLEGKLQVLKFLDIRTQNATRSLCTKESFSGSIEVSLDLEVYIGSSFDTFKNRLSVVVKDPTNEQMEFLHFFDGTGFYWKNETVKVEIIKNISIPEFSLCLSADYVNNSAKHGIYLSRFEAIIRNEETQSTEQMTTRITPMTTIAETTSIKTSDVTTTLSSTRKTPTSEKTTIESTTETGSSVTKTSTPKTTSTLSTEEMTTETTQMTTIDEMTSLNTSDVTTTFYSTQSSFSIKSTTIESTTEAGSSGTTIFSAKTTDQPTSKTTELTPEVTKVTTVVTSLPSSTTLRITTNPGTMTETPNSTTSEYFSPSPSTTAEGTTTQFYTSNDLSSITTILIPILIFNILTFIILIALILFLFLCQKRRKSKQLVEKAEDRSSEREEKQDNSSKGRFDTFARNYWGKASWPITHRMKETDRGSAPALNIINSTKAVAKDSLSEC